MTKEEVLAIINERRGEVLQEVNFLCERREGEVLAWAYQLVKQIEIPESVTTPLPQNEQNTVATGWQAAVTGELKQKR